LNFQCNQQDLSYGIQHVQKAVSNRNTLPVLLGIKLVAFEDTLTLSATDLELAVECTVKATVQENGEIVLPAKYFVDMIHNLPHGPVVFQLDPDSLQVKISSGKAEFNLHGISPDEFPALTYIEEEEYSTIPSEVLSKSIKQTSFALSNDESRPVFTGLLLEWTEERFRVVATDGYRLAVKSHSFNFRPDFPDVVVPGKTMTELLRILSNRKEEQIKMAIQGNQIYFRLSDTLVVSRLIEGSYPQYQQIIPQEKSITVELDREDFLHTLERVGVITKEGPNVIKLHITDKEKLVITANSPEIGDTYDEMTISPQKKDMEIAFNSKYLKDALKAIPTEKIHFSFIEELKPATMTPVGEEDYIYVVLPIRLAK